MQSGKVEKEILHFKGEWRSYQKRILDNLDYHLRDKKLHIVAAPGAGKTTLGIEVISRLNRPTLILCPTNTIKNQWKERICHSFLEKDCYGIVSTDIRNPKYITITTYQALLAAFCDNAENESTPSSGDMEYEDESTYSITSSVHFKQEKADITVDILKRAGISLLCFDEAHHLRKEWWKALVYLNDRLNPEQTLALTATPPYDAEFAEWERYQQLCGEIDEVISIPELVKNGDLCPHQDFIYISHLKKEERQLLTEHNRNIGILIDKLKRDTDLLEQLSGMAFFEANDDDVKDIYENPEFYVSIASLLNATGYNIPRPFLNLFGIKQNKLPKFDVNMAEEFFSGFLSTKDKDFAPLSQHKDSYYNTAKRLGLVANRKIMLSGSKKIRRQIAGSISKLDSIVEIVKLEHKQLHEKLRMVILTDLIKVNDLNCTSIGVVPIWKRLKDNFDNEISIGILCGSLIVLPKKATNKLDELLTSHNISPDSVSQSRFHDFDNYVRIIPKENVRNRIVSIVTKMFNCGDVTILIGTQALLGEGWDAPSINSLILSSTVSSYMLSNQMRGRAIRIDKNNPEKVSNIWHLATLDTPPAEEHMATTDSDYRDLTIYTHDIDQLSSRFLGFEAPSYNGNHEIMSGIERIADFNNPLLLGNEPLLKNVTTIHHRTTLALAKDREKTQRWWNDALYLGYDSKQVGLKTGVQTKSEAVKYLRYTSPMYYLFTLASILAVLCPTVGRIQQHTCSGFGTVILIAMIGVLAVLAYRFLKTGTIAGVMKQVSIVILKSLSQQNLIKTSLKNVGINVQNTNGIIFVNCTNLPTEENNLFMQCLQEFLDPIENPRYILVKYDVILKIFKPKDYFAIPTVLSRQKESVIVFKNLWERYIGKCDIVYTRNIEGRKTLLKARKEASSTSKREKSKRLSKWQ